MIADDIRLRAFWDERYQRFSLSESGWMGAGERLNDRIYACKTQALARSLAHLRSRDRFASFGGSVLDAGCGQGYFARFYRREYPSARYVGIDISERAVRHLHEHVDGAEFHVADLCEWIDPQHRTFDVVQSFEVLHLILDDDALVRALASLSGRLADGGALLVTAALPEKTLQPSDYLRYRSRGFWRDALASLNLRIAAERQMYYWLPAGGPRNKYARHALTRLGADALYALDRAAVALRVPQSSSAAIDCRMRLLTIERAG
jgi:SAM-dependent methyltransferase